MIPTLLDDARRDEPPEYRRVKGLPMLQPEKMEKRRGQEDRHVSPVIVA